MSRKILDLLTDIRYNRKNLPDNIFVKGEKFSRKGTSCIADYYWCGDNETPLINYFEQWYLLKSILQFDVEECLSVADKTFFNLGYNKIDTPYVCEYVKKYDARTKHIIFTVGHEVKIGCEDEDGYVNISDFLETEELKAILEKCNELGWIKECDIEMPF